MRQPVSFKLALFLSLSLPLQIAKGYELPSASLIAPTTDFTRPEPYEHLSGGTATARKTIDENSFSHPSANLSGDEKFQFKVGKAVFRQLWSPTPLGTTDIEKPEQKTSGLGPLFNARSCQLCHLKDGRGHPPRANWPQGNAVSMLLRLSIPPQTSAQRNLLAKKMQNVIPEPVYGGQLQDLAVPGQNFEGKIHVTYSETPVALSGGETASLRKPIHSISHLAYGSLHRQVMISARIAPQMIGLGLLASIKERDIMAGADALDVNKDGISGRPNQVWNKQSKSVVLGRFGWKAGQPTLAQQNAAAFANDIGISSSLEPDPAGMCTQSQENCRTALPQASRNNSTIELRPDFERLTNFYSGNLAVSARRLIADRKVLLGKKLFYQIGCIACHRPKFITGKNDRFPGLNSQLIWPYTDLLLHDMGPGLADHRPEGVANGREWRTAPLWGIGLTKTVSGHTFYLHDGRARNLLEAILWHGGEAQMSRDKVVAMGKNKRLALISFLNSL